MLVAEERKLVLVAAIKHLVCGNSKDGNLNHVQSLCQIKQTHLMRAPLISLLRSINALAYVFDSLSLTYLSIYTLKITIPIRVI